jgi:hypothetical protein
VNKGGPGPMGADAPTEQEETRKIIFTKFIKITFITNIPVFWRRFLPPSNTVL